MDKINVMVNGLPGKMSSKVAEHVLRYGDLELLPLSFTGAEIEEKHFTPSGGGKIELVRPQYRADALRGLESVSPFITVDFTHPSAVNLNAELYCENGFNFVTGTTGGDREKLAETVKTAPKPVSAVIAPNMAKEIVGIQAMMEYAANTFPDIFKGYKLSIWESHQSGKADTSGTAKAMVKYFNQMGIPFSADQIIMERNPEEQLKLGVPEEYLKGHGYHTYTLKSGDGTVLFKLEHDVNGRDVYAAGTIDAIRYLHRKAGEGARNQVYSMIDVLKGV